MAFCDNLRYITKVRGISQRELCHRMGLTSEGSAYYYFNARKPPKIDKLEKMAVALDCSIDDLTSPDLPIHITKGSPNPADYVDTMSKHCQGLTPEVLKEVSDYQHGRIPYVDAVKYCNSRKPNTEGDNPVLPEGFDLLTEEDLGIATEPKTEKAEIEETKEPCFKDIVLSEFRRIIAEEDRDLPKPCFRESREAYFYDLGKSLLLKALEQGV